MYFSCDSDRLKGIRSERLVILSSFGSRPIPLRQRLMDLENKFIQSSPGKRVILALSGFLLLVAVLGYLLINLQIFLGRSVFNSRMVAWREASYLRWTVTISLILILFVHVKVAIRLKWRAWQARPISYRRYRTLQASAASLSMALSGATVLAFLAFHVAWFNFRIPDQGYFNAFDPDGFFDAYAFAILAFQSRPYALSYLLAAIALGFHLSHAIPSIFSTLGLGGARYQRIVRDAGPSIAAAIALGYLAIPLCVFVGVLELPSGSN